MEGCTLGEYMKKAVMEAKKSVVHVVLPIIKKLLQVTFATVHDQQHQLF